MYKKSLFYNNNGFNKHKHIISGDDDLALNSVISGGDGVISVIGNALPKRFGSMVQQALFGQVIEARVTHHLLSPIIKAIFEEGNPSGIKSVMSTIGLCDDSVRLPLVPATTDLKKKLYSCLADLEVEIA